MEPGLTFELRVPLHVFGTSKLKEGECDDYSFSSSSEGQSVEFVISG